MQKTLQDAINKLISESKITCVTIKENKFITSDERGLRPLMRPMLVCENSLKDTIIADKVIGRAAASIIIFGKVKECYGHLMSKGAVEFFQKNNVFYKYNTLVDRIENSDGTDNCPMEKMISHLENEHDCYVYLRDFLKDKLIKSSS